MPKITLQALGRKLVVKRGTNGIREIAKAIGISAATLSRVERGHVPDLETFGRVCRWVNIDPGEVLGFKPRTEVVPAACVHFRKDEAIAPATAEALAQMILAAQRALMLSKEPGGE